jgi:predicted double-glycine peptidase
MQENGVIIQKWDISCGAAALATILTYQHSDPVPERTIATAMLKRDEYRSDPLLVQHRGGFSLLDLKRYVETRGYVGTGYAQMTLDSLGEFTPAIVPLAGRKTNHFVVYRGQVGDRVLLADPAFGNRTMKADEFNEAWATKVIFVVHRKDGLDPPNQLALKADDILRPSSFAIRDALR